MMMRLNIKVRQFQLFSLWAPVDCNRKLNSQIFSPCIMCVQYIGGYHEYIGGIIMSTSWPFQVKECEIILEQSLVTGWLNCQPRFQFSQTTGQNRGTRLRLQRTCMKGGEQAREIRLHHRK